MRAALKHTHTRAAAGRSLCACSPSVSCTLTVGAMRRFSHVTRHSSIKVVPRFANPPFVYRRRGGRVLYFSSSLMSIHPVYGGVGVVSAIVMRRTQHTVASLRRPPSSPSHLASRSWPRAGSPDSVCSAYRRARWFSCVLSFVCDLDTWFVCLSDTSCEIRARPPTRCTLAVPPQVS